MKVLSVSSDFSIKGVMEFCKCSQLSALYFLCYLLRETKCHRESGSVSTLNCVCEELETSSKALCKIVS